MEEYRTVRRMFELSPMGKRSKGHPRNRWQDEIQKDIRVLGVKNWTKMVKDRTVCHDQMEKSKTH